MSEKFEEWRSKKARGTVAPSRIGTVFKRFLLVWHEWECSLAPRGWAYQTCKWFESGPLSAAMSCPQCSTIPTRNAGARVITILPGYSAGGFRTPGIPALVINSWKGAGYANGMPIRDWMVGIPWGLRGIIRPIALLPCLCSIWQNPFLTLPACQP